MPGPSGLLYDDPSLSDFSDLMKPWGLRREDLRQPPPQQEQDWTALGPEPDPSQLQLQGQMQSPPPMQNIDLTPSLPSFSGDPRMQQPQFDLGSPHPDVNGETYLPPVSAGSEVGSVTSFDAPRPFSEGFVGAPKAGSTGWDTLGRGVSDALGGAAYNVLTLGGPSSVRTSPNLLMRPGQMSSAELHPGLPDFPDSAPQDFNANLMPLSGGAVLGPQADDSLEGAPQSTIPSANPAPIDGGLVLADEDNNPNDADDLAARPTMAYRDTGDNGVPTFGVSDYVTGSTGAPAIDGLNDADLARFVAQDGGGSGLSLPTAPDGFDIASVEYKPMEGNNPAQYIPHFASHELNPTVRAQQEFDLNQQGLELNADRQMGFAQFQSGLESEQEAAKIKALKDAGAYDRNAGVVGQKTQDSNLDSIDAEIKTLLGANDAFADDATRASNAQRLSFLRSQADAIRAGGSPLPTTSAGVEAVRGATSKQIAAAVAEWEKSNPGRQPTPAEKDAIRQRALSFR